MELVNSGAQGHSYRLFANITVSGRVHQVQGNVGSELLISTAHGAGWYPNANGGPTSKEINSNSFQFVSSLEWDSYISIGARYADVRLECPMWVQTSNRPAMASRMARRTFCLHQVSSPTGVVGSWVAIASANAVAPARIRRVRGTRYGSCFAIQ